MTHFFEQTPQNIRDSLNNLFENWNESKIIKSENPINIKVGTFEEKFLDSNYKNTRQNDIVLYIAKDIQDSAYCKVTWLNDNEYITKVFQTNGNLNFVGDSVRSRIIEITDSSYFSIDKSIFGIFKNEFIKK